jgi:hypothetical protein
MTLKTKTPPVSVGTPGRPIAFQIFLLAEEGAKAATSHLFNVGYVVLRKGSGESMAFFEFFPRTFNPAVCPSQRKSWGSLFLEKGRKVSPNYAYGCV